jgi:hypothetical protein
VHSALTQPVSVIKTAKLNAHAAFDKFKNGPLPNLGLIGKNPYGVAAPRCAR